MLDRARARDKNYDGKFITGVHSTGIYCLPSCPARNPNEENIRFFSGEAEAQEAGLRPCRRCRPDLFYRNYDPDLETALELSARIRENPAKFQTVTELADISGWGVTRLTKLFRTHFHTSPAAFLQRERIARGRRLLLDNNRSIPEIAFETGYESLSAFHDAFLRTNFLTPGEFRQMTQRGAFTLALPGNYRPEIALRLLGRDTLSPCERVEGKRFSKALPLDGSGVTLVIKLQAKTAECKLETGRTPDPEWTLSAHRAALRLLGLPMNPARFEKRISSNDGLSRLISRREGLRIPQTATVFEGLVWAILGQQVNLAFAMSLRRQLIELHGIRAPGNMVAHPAPKSIAQLDYEDLTRHRISRRKAEYLIDTARKTASGDLPLEDLPSDAATSAEKKLLAIRGIGKWSASYVMMRSCAFIDCVPIGDTGLTTALQKFYSLEERPGPDETINLMERFAPYRSLATFHLWMTLGDPV